MSRNKNNKSRKPNATEPPGRRAPKAGASVPGQRAPVAIGVDGHDHKIVWRFSMLDMGGPWGWAMVTIAQWEMILAKIRDWETQTLGELFNHARHKPIPLESLCPGARARLEEINLDDLDVLWELGLGNKPRIWGHRDRHIFYPLWWDPEHTVCPSTKKHT